MKNLLLSLASLTLVISTSIAAVPPPERLLPEDTLGMVTVPNYSAARKNWDASAGGQLFLDPSIKPFKDKFLAKLRTDVVEPVEKEFGIKFADYSGLSRGQVTLALTRNGWEGQPDVKPGFILAIDSGDQSAKLKTNLENLKKKWTDGGKQMRTEKIRDVEFTVYIFSGEEITKAFNKIFPDPNAGWETVDAPKPDEKKAPSKTEWFVGQSDSLLLVGDSAKELERVLVRQAGGEVPPLADKATFSSIFNSSFRDANCYGWVDINAILTVVAKQAKAAGGEGGDAPRRRRGGPDLAGDKMLSALGLMGLKTLSFTEKQAPDGSLYQFAAAIPESDRRGLFKILAIEPREAAPPAFVPADAVKFSRTRLDLPKAIDQIEKTLTDAAPQMAGLFKMVVDSAGKEKDPNFDLRSQLIANLGDDLISYEKTPRKLTLDGLNSPPSIFLISSPKPQELASALRALSGLLPQQAAKVREREFLGRTIYSIGLPNMQGRRGGAQAERLLHYAASGGYVALSTDPAMLEEYLRSNVGDAKSLKDTPGLGEAAQKVGGMNTGLFGFEDQRETSRVALEILKKESGSLANLIGASPFAGRLGLNENPNAFKDWLDFSLLPPFDQISKYFGIAVWAGAIDANGMTISLFAPTPSQLKK